jgi:hypothetical protein
MHRFPAFELSYETFAHKKVPSTYDICLTIPAGKKQLLWFTFDKNDDITILLDLNKSRQIVKTERINIPTLTEEIHYDTLLYGTIIQVEPVMHLPVMHLPVMHLPVMQQPVMQQPTQVFIIEDIYHYRGINVKAMLFGEKLTFLQKLFIKDLPRQQDAVSPLLLALPYMRVSTENDIESLPFYESFTKPAKYQSHHIQFRSSSTVAPYLNHIYKKPQTIADQIQNIDILVPRTDCDYRLPAYSKTVVFKVVADIRDDVYHLFAQDTYVGVSYIGTRNQSKYMNSLFRNIKENINIDYGEESDDEECFQDLRVDKYVDLTREHKIECVFNRKFRMWEPIKKVEQGQCIHITELVADKRVNNNNLRPYPNNNNSNNNLRLYQNNNSTNNNNSRPYSNNNSTNNNNSRPYSNNNSTNNNNLRPYSNNNSTNNNNSRPYNNNNNNSRPYPNNNNTNNNNNLRPSSNNNNSRPYPNNNSTNNNNNSRP